MKTSAFSRFRSWPLAALGLAVGMVITTGWSQALADTLETRDGRVIKGRYMGGTQRTVRFEGRRGLEVFTMAEIAALTFDRRSGDDGAVRPLPDEDRVSDNESYDDSYGRGEDRLIARLPGPARKVTYHGRAYYYVTGVFYRPAGRGWRIVEPPLGIMVPSLPPGHTVIRANGQRYYYFDGLYFTWRPRSIGYVVVGPPLGAIVFSPPSRSLVVKIKGVKCYRHGKYWYKPRRHKGRPAWEVVIF